VAQQRLPVRKIREVLRLKAAGFSDRKIAAAIGSARSTVQECVRRASEAGLVWPLSPELDEEALQARLYRREVPLSQRPRPDFAQIDTNGEPQPVLNPSTVAQGRLRRREA